MTLVSDIITDAHRVSNILAIGDTPSDEENAEGLRYINRIVKSVFGNEVGDPLEPFPIGRKGISRPSGYPWWDTVPSNDWFVPKNTRVMLNVDTTGLNLYLHPAPDPGSRFAALDVSNDLSTFPVIVHGNGNTIDGVDTLTLDTDGFNAEWFYREDLGQWQKYAPLLLTDTFPFPLEFDDYFVTLLACRINPSYGVQMDVQTQKIMQRSKSQLAARYTQEIPVRSELALIRPTRMAADRDQWGNTYWLYQPNSMFDKGWPW